ncbi:hypothetical protein Tco_1523582 [Tanacetum coccineum]
MKKSMLLKLDANNAKEPITPNISHLKKKENPRRSLLHAIWWTFSRRGYRAAALGFYQRNNVNPSYQERRQSMEDTLSKFMSESTKRHEENSNLIKEIRASTDTAIRNQGASIKTLEIQIGKMSKVLQERGFKSLPRSTEANPRDQVKSISSLLLKVTSYPIRRIRSSQYAVSAGQKRKSKVMILMPTIEEGEVIEEFRTRDDELDTEIDDYPSYCDYDKKIHIDYKMVYKGNNVIGALMNVPNFVGTFSVVMDFAVLEDMDAYRDEGMGDVIFGKPFLREVGIKTRWFKGPRERNIDEYWWRIYKSGDLEVLES